MTEGCCMVHLSFSQSSRYCAGKDPRDAAGKEVKAGALG